MRLGGPVFQSYSDAHDWMEALRQLGYGATYVPLKPSDSDADIRAFSDAAAAAEVVIAEVGAWSNPISPNDAEQRKAMKHCQDQLALADRVGARCCVNITGSRGKRWNGPFAADLLEETFDLIVESIRAIIDAVRPARTFYAIETMPWMVPDSPDSYLRLIRAVDRRQLAVHLDPVNLLNSPSRYFNNAAFMRECFAKLGPMIKSCHAKDVLIGDQLTLRLNEVRPGLGALDYDAYLEELNKIGRDVPLMLEHLDDAKEYDLAADHIRSVAQSKGLKFRCAIKIPPAQKATKSSPSSRRKSPSSVPRRATTSRSKPTKSRAARSRA